MKIEFREGEKWCRADGELCDPSWCKKFYGDEIEVDVTADYILAENYIYLRNHTSLKALLDAIGKYQKPGEYDESLSRGLGKARQWTEEAILGKGAWVIQDRAWLEDLFIKPYKQFEKDYPNFNMKKYLEFDKALNDYYTEQGHRK